MKLNQAEYDVLDTIISWGDAVCVYFLDLRDDMKVRASDLRDTLRVMGKKGLVELLPRDGGELVAMTRKGLEAFCRQNGTYDEAAIQQIVDDHDLK